MLSCVYLPLASLIAQPHGATSAYLVGATQNTVALDRFSNTSCRLFGNFRTLPPTHTHTHRVVLIRKRESVVLWTVHTVIGTVGFCSPVSDSRHRGTNLDILCSSLPLS